MLKERSPKKESLHDRIFPKVRDELWGYKNERSKGTMKVFERRRDHPTQWIETVEKERIDVEHKTGAIKTKKRIKNDERKKKEVGNKSEKKRGKRSEEKNKRGREKGKEKEKKKKEPSVK